VDEQSNLALSCPVCGDTHSYTLMVERAHILGLTMPDTLTTRTRSFVRLFTCPVKGTQFQATLKLRESGMEQINKVTIGDAT